MGEIVVEFILTLILSYPGGFIRWGLNGFKKGQLKKYLNKDAYQNTLFFLFFLY